MICRAGSCFSKGIANKNARPEKTCLFSFQGSHVSHRLLWGDDPGVVMEWALEIANPVLQAGVPCRETHRGMRMRIQRRPWTSSGAPWSLKPGALWSCGRSPSGSSSCPQSHLAWASSTPSTCFASSSTWGPPDSSWSIKVQSDLSMKTLSVPSQIQVSKQGGTAMSWHIGRCSQQRCGKQSSLRPGLNVPECPEGFICPDCCF